MKLFGLGMPELVVILLVILVIFGPKNLPKLGSALGKAVKGVREGVDSVNTELEAAKESIDNSDKEKTGAKVEDTPITATAVVEEAEVEEAVSDVALFCSKCGAGLESDAKFCKKCGAQTN